MSFSAIRERVTVDVIRWAPKGLYSAAIGWGARLPLPRLLRTSVHRTFARAVGARLDEVELPLDEYLSLSEFFARRLQVGAREIAGDPRSVISPCDGVVAALGRATDGRMIQAKGRDYSLTQLVVDEDLAAKLAGGIYTTIYLSPRDYHRVHAPISAKLIGYDYVPGTLFPVNPLFSRSINDLMAVNERIVFHLQTEVGAAALVMVAALGVSNMEVACDRIETRYLRPGRVQRKVRFDAPIEIRRGDELGAFHLGSTTILLFQPGRITLDEMAIGQFVRFGQAIGRAGVGGGHAGSVGIIG